MAPTKSQLIIFDLDDTLAPAGIIYDEALIELGISPKDPTFLKARELVKQRLPSMAPVARSRFLYLKRYLELKGQYSTRKSLELGEAYEALVVQKMGEAWIRLNRRALFLDLKSRGFKLAVLSNETCRMQTRKLAQFEGADHFFEYLLTSEEKGFEKPEPLLFQELLQFYNLQPHEILMIGDSYENDIEPCLKLGIPCLQTFEFLSPKKKHSQVIEKLDQILNFI